jgi:hypothetical protein
MQPVAGAILVLAGSVLISAGIIADELARGTGRGPANDGYVLGVIVGLAGTGMLLYRTLAGWWESIPTGARPSVPPDQGDG